MILNAMAYSIIIPVHSSLIIEFYSPFPSIIFTEALESFYETPFYGTPNFRQTFYNLTYEISDGLSATFTVSDIEISNEGMLLLIDSNNQIFRLHKTFLYDSINFYYLG